MKLTIVSIIILIMAACGFWFTGSVISHSDGIDCLVGGGVLIVRINLKNLWNVPIPI